jgi:non-specific serine/threonine protein kinase
VEDAIKPPCPFAKETRREPDWALTPRECEVAEAFAAGLTYRQVADKLGIAVETVSTHSRAIRRKLGVKTKTELALLVARKCLP